MKNLIQSIAILLLVAGAVPNGLSANNNSASSLSGYATVAEQFIAANPLEKVYLHMDNTSYFVDDTLWFKAYTVNAALNRPTEASEILHVELLNPEGVIVRTQKYRLEGGKCDGSLKLDRELLSGFFEIRAYTKGCSTSVTKTTSHAYSPFSRGRSNPPRSSTACAPWAT
ncbi:MAG: hypothetical protein SNH63_01060 [Rikenellaceae bacterium]